MNEDGKHKIERVVGIYNFANRKFDIFNKIDVNDSNEMIWDTILILQQLMEDIDRRLMIIEHKLMYGG